MTKPQKIEGGWESEIRKNIVAWNHTQGYSKDDLIKDIATEIEKAVASERQRCVEEADKLMNENSLDSTQLVIDRQSWKNLKDQAKHKLMK